MSLWVIAEWGAWLISAGIFLWMLTDALMVGRRYGEDVLLSSREGMDELFPDAGRGIARDDMVDRR